MRFGLNLPPHGPHADARLLADLAREAEEAGWDGFFIWDHMAMQEPGPVVDPWVALTAAAMQTSRILLGTMVTPLARRRPWTLARQTASLDQLSGGRLVLGVGLGLYSQEFEDISEEAELRVRSEMVDEALDVLTGLWTGGPFKHHGPHYRIETSGFTPAPVQQPRIPIWVAGMWPNKRPFRRAAQWDGVYPIDREVFRLPAEAYPEIVDYTLRHRTGEAPFEIINTAVTGGADRGADTALVRAYADAGVTWWLERIWFDRHDRIRMGPPRL